MAALEKLGRFRDFGLLMIRAGLGASMILHGYPKLIGGPDRWKKIGGAMANLGLHDFPHFWGFMAAFSEGIGGLLIILGLFFRPASLLILFTMIVEAISHLAKGDGIDGASHALELAFAFAGLLFIGPGRFSLDKR